MRLRASRRRCENLFVTLIVARAGDWGVRVASDLRVTDREAVKGGYGAGVLKSIVLNRGLCVSFAGTPVTAALDAVRRQVDRASDVLAVEQGLLAEHRQLDGRVDFLVAALGPPRLSVLTGGELRGPVPNGWIGDYDAFSAYQRVFHHQPSSLPPGYEARREELEIGSAMMTAMDQVIGDDAVPSVGETAIHVVPEPIGFRYSNAARMVGGFVPQSIPSGVPTRIRFGGAAEGGFAYSTLVPDAVGIGAVGLYFRQGRFGLFYQPLRFDFPERYPNVSHDEFREAVMQRRGIAIEGAMIT